MTADWMGEAFIEAQKACNRDEVPVGAVIIYNHQIIARAGNEMRGSKDPTAHAEILALRAAASVMGNERLTGCSLYVTLEPCAMCAAAIALARIGRLYFAAPDPKSGAVEHGVRFFHQPSCHHKIEVYSGIGQDRSEKLLKKFFLEKRQLNKG